MRTKAKKMAVLLVGWAFILLGVIGLFLPVLQGVLFLLIGLFILSSEYVWAHQLLLKLRRRYPTLDARWVQAHAAAQKWISKVWGGIRAGAPHNKA